MNTATKQIAQERHRYMEFSRSFMNGMRSREECLSPGFDLCSVCHWKRLECGQKAKLNNGFLPE
jgi:hypothetical protein